VREGRACHLLSLGRRDPPGRPCSPQCYPERAPGHPASGTACSAGEPPTARILPILLSSTPSGAGAEIRTPTPHRLPHRH
jgi:hypothetical protein